MLVAMLVMHGLDCTDSGHFFVVVFLVGCIFFWGGGVFFGFFFLGGGGGGGSNSCIPLTEVLLIVFTSFFSLCL